MLNHNHLFGQADVPSRQIAPRLLANEFGEVSVRKVGDELQVAATLSMGAFVIGDGENCHVGLALDASDSMRSHYGRRRFLPAKVAKRYIDDGLYRVVERDGVKCKVLTEDARRQAVEKKLYRYTENRVREPSIQLIDNMVRTFSTGGADKGVCEVIYWACEKDGSGIEPVGTLSLSELEKFQISGPQHKNFGTQTHLAPALHYFLQQAGDASGMFVFLTDGRIDDENRVVDVTHQMAARMAEKGIYPPNIHCVLIGVGDEVDEEQFSRIDDMAMPEELKNYDIWNSKVFAEMRDISDAWSEIFDPTTTIATRAVVYDDAGNTVKEWTDNVTALIAFTMPSNSRSFVLEIRSEDDEAEPFRIQQTVGS